MLMQGKNAGNPDGLPSILTWQKRKLTIENRGSDNFCHPKGDVLIEQNKKMIARHGNDCYLVVIQMVIGIAGSQF